MTTPVTSDGTLSSLDDGAAEQLRERITGAVLTPDHEDYRAACSGFNVAHVSRPAVVVRAADTADVVEAVRFAAAVRLPVTVQATGHGFGPAADGALMIVTSDLTDVVIDPDARTARVQAGAKWAAVLGPAQEHGLAPLLGSTTDVGVVGYTLGGGMGWLARRYGLASDSVRSIDLVTPDGVEVHTSATVNPDLFWALRGGGAGTLGVVTEVELELYPVSTVYGGNLFYPVELAGDVLRRWRDWIVGMDEHLTSAVTVINFPPLPMVPEHIRGKSFVLLRGAWCGPDLHRGKELIDQWRAWRQPELDAFGPMPFVQADMISMDPVDPLPAIVGTEWLETVPDEVVDILVEAAAPQAGQPPRVLFAELRHAGGAVRAKAAAATNDRGRAGEVVLEVVAVPPTPEEYAAMDAHLRRTLASLQPYVTGAAYLNFLDGDDRRTRAASAFSAEHLERLRDIKADLDPDNRFRFGFGIADA